MEKTARIFVAGHRGLVGSAITRALQAIGYTNLILKARDELDLTNFSNVAEFFAKEKPAYVFLAAAMVGGIYANDTRGGDFIYDNLAIELNVLKNAKDFGVKKLLFLGSSCIYPREAPQPMKEEYLLTGPLEETNKPYAVAKIAGIVMCQAFHKQYGTNFISPMPTNLYGPGDNFDLTSSHVLPALIRKFHDAKLSGASAVTIWGTGTPRREFLFVDDLADACLFLMNNYDEPDIINVGVGEDITINELASLVAQIVGFTGTIEHDLTKPDGTMQKLLDVSRIHARGWQAQTDLQDGIAKTYAWFLAHPDHVRQ